MENRNQPPPENPSSNESRKPWEDDVKEDQGFIAGLLERFKKDKSDDDEGETERSGGLFSEKAEKGDKSKAREAFDGIFGFFVSREKIEDKPPETQPPTQTEVFAGQSEPVAEPQPEPRTETEFIAPGVPELQPLTPAEEQPVEEEPLPTPPPRRPRELRPISGGAPDESELAANRQPENNPYAGVEQPQPQSAQETLESPTTQTPAEFAVYNPANYPPRMSEQVNAPPINIQESVARPNRTHPLDAEYGRISSVFPALAVDIMARGRDRRNRRRAIEEETRLGRRIDKLEDKAETTASQIAYHELGHQGVSEVPGQKEAVFAHEKAEVMQSGIPNKAPETLYKDAQEIAKVPPETILKEVEKAAEKGAPIEGMFERSHEVKETTAQQRDGAGFSDSYGGAYGYGNQRTGTDNQSGYTPGNLPEDLAARQTSGAKYSTAVKGGLIVAVIITAAIIVAVVFF